MDDESVATKHLALVTRYYVQLIQHGLNEYMHTYHMCANRDDRVAVVSILVCYKSVYYAICVFYVSLPHHVMLAACTPLSILFTSQPFLYFDNAPPLQKIGSELSIAISFCGE